MKRTRNWFLIGTILPALTLAQAGLAAPAAGGPTQFAQAPTPSDDAPGRPRRQDRPEQERGRDRGGAEARPEARPDRAPGAERPRPERPAGAERPAASQPAAPVAPRPAPVPPAAAPAQPTAPRLAPPAPATQSAPVPPAAAPAQPDATRPAPVPPASGVTAPVRAPAAPNPPAQAAPPAAPPQQGSAVPAQGQPNAPDRQGRRGGISPGGAAAIGLGAGVLGAIMATQGADRLDDVRSRREERREGDVTIIREPGRTIIRDDDRVIIRRDETQRFRDLGIDQRVERRGGETRTVFERPDGTRIVTITDAEGRLIRRTRQTRGGEEFVIIDNTRRDRPGRRFSDEIVVLERPALRIPRERYVVDAEAADQRLIFETITAPPLAPLPRRYTLDEVRYSPDLRARMRSVDIDTITFETASWEVSQGQAQRLRVIADSVLQALRASPTEVFLIEGHTDAVGADIDNLSLSDRRAQSVAEILSRDFGVPPENLTTQGYGEQYLKVNTQEDSRENRRVTLRRITPLLAGGNAPQ